MTEENTKETTEPLESSSNGVNEDTKDDVFNALSAETAQETISISALRNAMHEALPEEEVEPIEGKTEETEEDTTEEQEAEVEVKDEEEAEEDSEEEKKEYKFTPKDIKLSEGEKEFVVPNNAMVEITVDGKKRTLPFQEVLNRASGDVAVHDRLNEVNRLKIEHDKIWQQRQAIINEVNEKIKRESEFIENLATLTTEGSPEDLLIYCARKTDQDPRDVIKQFLEEAMSWGDKFRSMSQVEQQSWFDSLETKIQQQQLEEERKILEEQRYAYQSKEAERKLEEYATIKLKEAEVEHGTFVDMGNTLRQKGIQLKGETPESRVDEVLDYIHEDRIYSAAKKIDPELLKDTKLLQQVYDVTRSLNIHGEERIEKVLREVIGTTLDKEGRRIAENLSRKVRRSGTTPEKAKDASVKDEDVGPFTISQFIEQHRGA